MAHTNPTRKNRRAACRFAVLIVLMLGAASARGQQTWVSTDFSHPTKACRWIPVTGAWRTDSGLASIRTTDYDQLLAVTCYTYTLQSYSIETVLRGNRAGIFFCLDDTVSKVLSHMVRFDDNSVLTGYFDAGGNYTATNTFSLPKSPTDWTHLRIDVDPRQKRYEVFVNGVSVGVDDHLMFPSGYVGLEASDGVSEFRSLSISSDAKQKIPSRPRIGRKIQFQHVSYVQAREKNVALYNPELRLWQTLNPDGKVIAQEFEKLRPVPESQVRVRNLTYEIRRHQVYVADEAGRVVGSLYEHLVAPSAIIVDDRISPLVIDIADPGARAIFQFDPDGKLKGTIDGETIGGFKAPRGIALYGDRDLVIADYDKLVFYDPSVDAEPVTFTDVSPTEVEVDWHSMTRLHTFVEYSPDGGTTRTVSRVSVRPNGQRAAFLRNLDPLSRYSCRVSPTLNTIPEEFTHSKTYRFTTRPSDSLMTAVTRLPVLYLVYRTISYRDKYPRAAFPHVPDGRTMTDEDIEYLRQAIAFNRQFYFRNSSCRLVLDFDLFVVQDTLWLHEVGDSDPYWLPPNDRVTRDYEQAARHFGRAPTYYAGLVCPYAWVNYPPRRTSAMSDPSVHDSINIRQAVGGGTYGVPAPWKYGATTGFTSMPFQDKFSRQDWLLTHEFHHQIDALQAASGYPGYYHADIPWQMPGRFGEDFDFNAHIIRNAPVNTWLSLRFGALAQVRDADHDGVPDDDPSLPFDEKRLGGNPNKKDSDGDGLDDLQEVMAGTAHGTVLSNKDSDGDGLIDSEDPEPLYPINPVITKLTNPGDLLANVFSNVKADDLHGSTYLRWDDHFLYFVAITDTPANILVQVDANDDGWFHGFDNFQARVMNNGDSCWVADYYLRDCSSWSNVPRDRRDILKRSDLLISTTKTPARKPDGKTEYSVTIQLPRNDTYGLNLVPGKRMSVRFGLQTKTDLWVWDELFERNYMMQITLR